MSFQCKGAATSIRNLSAHPICSTFDLVWGKPKSTKSCLGDGLHRSDLAKRSPILSDCNPPWQLCDLRLKNTKSTPWYDWATKKNNLGYLLSIESWLVHRDPYNGLSLFSHNWVGWHPLCTLNNQIFFHCSIEKENSSKSCSTIPLSKNYPPNSTTMNRMGFSSMVLDFRILKNNGLNSGLKLKIFKPWIAGSILLPSIPTQLPFFALQVALDLGP